MFVFVFVLCLEMPALAVSAAGTLRGRGVRRPHAEGSNTGAGRASGVPSQRYRVEASAFRPSGKVDRDSDDDNDEVVESDGVSGSASGSRIEDSDDEQAELDRLREGVKDVPFEVVQKLGALGSSRAAGQSESSSRRPRGPAHVKRANKNAPQEVSSKIRVGIIPAHARAAARERKGRDPRFDRLSGKLSEDLFEKSYAWMNAVAERDAKELRAVASKEKDAESRAALLMQASQIEQKLKQGAKKSEETKLKRARKKAMMEVASSTGKAFWLKKRELRQIDIARKYETLKAKGKGAVDDYGACLSMAFVVSRSIARGAYCIPRLASNTLSSLRVQLPRSASELRRKTIASSHAVAGATSSILGCCA